jgi:hypothetical protein
MGPVAFAHRSAVRCQSHRSAVRRGRVRDNARSPTRRDLVSHGNTPDLIARAHDSGVIWIQTVGDVQQAEQALAASADVLVAQGTEGGGNAGWITTMAQVPAIVDVAGAVPVVAACHVTTLDVEAASPGSSVKVLLQQPCQRVERGVGVLTFCGEHNFVAV